MAFCSNCGKELAADAKFCSGCGVAVDVLNKNEKSQRKTVYDGDVHKCPNCGEILGAFATVCPSCKYELRGTEITSRVHELSQKLENAKSVENKIELISNFYIPNTKEDIYEFFILAFSNISVGTDCTEAWSVKLEQAYLKAKLAFGNGEDFKYIQELYDKIKKVLSKNKMLKSQDSKSIISFSIGLVMLLGGLIATYIDGTNNSVPFIVISALGFIPFVVGIVMFIIPNKTKKKSKKQ